MKVKEKRKEKVTSTRIEIPTLKDAKLHCVKKEVVLIDFITEAVKEKIQKEK